MVSLTGALILCVIALSMTELAKGCDQPPQPYDLYKYQCAIPVPSEYSNCRVIQSDCGCQQLECTAPCSKQGSVYPLTKEASGVLTFVNNGVYFLVNVQTNSVTVSSCVRSVCDGRIVVFALDSSGELCVASVDDTGVIIYTVVKKLAVSYAPGNSITLSSVDYNSDVLYCSTPLPEEFTASAVKRIVYNSEGSLVLSCAIINSAVVLDYTLTLIPDAGVYTCQKGSTYYLVHITKKTIVITMQTAFVTDYNQKTTVFVLNNINQLCTAWYEVESSSIQLTPVSESVMEIKGRSNQVDKKIKPSTCGCP